MAKGSVQQPLPPMEVRKTDDAAGGAAGFRRSECDQNGDASFRNSEPVTADSVHAISAALFDEALENAHLTSKDVAFLWNCSVSNVEKMRSRGMRTCPSLVQLLLLPPRFHYELHKALNRRYGYGRQALRELLDVMGTLALVVER